MSSAKARKNAGMENRIMAAESVEISRDATRWDATGRLMYREGKRAGGLTSSILNKMAETVAENKPNW